MSRYEVSGKTATFRFKSYLGPYNLFPYNDLSKDLEAAHKEGFEVVLLSVPGFVMLSSFQGSKKPWGKTVGFKFKTFKTAREALTAY